MKFKVDENLPVEIADMLRNAGHDAFTVVEQKLGGKPDPDIMKVCVDERRVLVTLDTDFADILTYPPKESTGIVVMRIKQHDKQKILSVFSRILPLFEQESLEQKLCIVGEKKVRIRE